METIKNYLESMFANMPNTEEVLRAKRELLQMMEDKYHELIREGQSENAAIGTVISEFGNLEEISEDLGISQEVKAFENIDRRKLSMDEVKDYLKSQASYGMYIAWGVFFCITSLCYVMIFTDKYNGLLGVVCMFISVAVGVFCFVFSSAVNKKWDYIKDESCCVDLSSVNWVKEQKEQYRISAAMKKTIGIILCVLSVIPVMIIDEMQIKVRNIDMDNLGGASLFFVVAIGVFLIIYSSIRMGSYDNVLVLNDNVADGNSKKSNSGKREIRYENPVVDGIMSVFWPTVTCIYLSWSFLTFDWHITWIIWVVASLIQTIVNAIFEERN